MKFVDIVCTYYVYNLSYEFCVPHNHNLYMKEIHQNLDGIGVNRR